MASIERLAEIRFPARADQLKLLRGFVREASIYAGCSNDVVEEIVLAVNEGCMNVIQHAYKGDESRDMLLKIFRDGPNVVFRLIDFAEPTDTTTIRPRDLGELRPGGLGTHFMNELMDACVFGHLETRAGNYVEMTKRIA
ncbi:MAG: ATP-binding protein [Pseudomonadota bacterium]